MSVIDSESKVSISIVVPCYNQAQYLDECLQSVLDSFYENWECIIVNDGSLDNTKEVALLWCSKDERFKYIEQENGGLSNARNAGIRYAMGKYILPLDADDKISTDYIDKAMKCFSETPDIDLIYCNVCHFGTINMKLSLPEYNYEKLLIENIFTCSSILKKESWTRAGGYDESMRIGLEDWDFWLRILNKESKVLKLPILGFYYRHTQGSMSDELMSNRIKNEPIINYMYKKHIYAIENYLSYIHYYHVLTRDVCNLKNNYMVLAKQIKMQNLMQAICFKFAQKIKMIFRK